MSSRPDLKVDWCSYEAAKYAVMHWHYSKKMPKSKLVKLGVWEGGQFIGCVIFGRGANNHIGSPYGLEQIAVCELVRVALTDHQAPVTRIMSDAIKGLKAVHVGLRLIVSYADPEQGHLGIIYQAGNWTYTGRSQSQRFTLGLSGEIVHKRVANLRHGTITGLPKSKKLWKYKYLYPLDRAMRRQIEPLRKPYPKRASEAK